MLAVLLLFAMINGLLVYSMIKKSDSENIDKFKEVLYKNEKISMELRLNFVSSIIYPYTILSTKYPDSTDAYKAKILEFLKESYWNSKQKHHNFYFIFEGNTGNAILFRDSIGNLLPVNTNVYEIKDANGKKFVQEIMQEVRSIENDTAVITFTYFKPCMVCASVEKMVKGIYIKDWDWVVATGNYTDDFSKVTGVFSKNFTNSRLILMGNLFGIMLISFLVGLFMVFRQMNSFIVPLRNLSDYIHRLATEGVRFETFNLSTKSQSELLNFSKDLNSFVNNVGSFIENVRTSADRVSDLSGACTDMLDIVDYDAKLVGQRTAEMATSSKEVVENVTSMAIGIEEINLNLDGLKTLVSHAAENTADIKSSISQMSNSIKELNEESHNVENNVISVTQAVNDIGIANFKEFNEINDIEKLSTELYENFGNMAERISELRKNMNLMANTLQKTDAKKEETSEAVKNICHIADDLQDKIISVQIRFSELKDNKIVPLALIIGERRNLSKEISSDTLELKNSITSITGRIAEINLNSQYINTNVKQVSYDMNEAYHNVDEIVVSTYTMNEHAKQVRNRMDEFLLKSKRVEEAHSAIEHTLVDVKDSMKSLNDLSASLRKTVDDLVRLNNKT
jgi:methyl-accepting chemotaxis protein-2 (aspartate sensor receptor)